MNPWHELGLQEGADPEDVRRAYRRLAAEHHPDRHPDDADAVRRFQRVCQAYEMLQEPKQRQRDPDFGGPSDHGPGSWGPSPDSFGGVHFRFVAPPELQRVLMRMRRVMALVLVLGLVGVTSMGHALRGLAWDELLWPHQLVLSFGAGLAACFAAFIVWVLGVGLLGFRWGTVFFWMSVLLTVF